MKEISYSRTLAASAIVLMTLCAFEVAADSTMSALELRKSCAAYAADLSSADGRSCAAYLQGFIDAALARMVAVRSDATAQESWLERARRTRLGTARPGACLDPAVSISRLTREVLTHADTHVITEKTPASRLVADTLRRFHPCGRAAHSRSMVERPIHR